VPPSYAARATLAGMSSETERLAAARRGYAELEPRVIAGGPWPLAEDYGNGPEASWGPGEVLAHVAEMLPFWLGEMERVIDGEGSAPVPFGRIADDPVRIGIVGRDRSLPLRVLFARVDDGLEDWADRLATLTNAERSRIGVHPRLGEMRASAIVERFVLDHGEEHVAQLTEILAARTA
jgi:DinB superfamily